MVYDQRKMILKSAIILPESAILLTGLHYPALQNGWGARITRPPCGLALRASVAYFISAAVLLHCVK
jgi:hypothetical protein